MTQKVQLFMTCLGENFYPDMLRDMVSVLKRVGVECELPDNQTCCGQPFFNSGYTSAAVKPARQWLRAFGDTDGYIVSPSASCVGFIRKNYPNIFPDGTPEHAAALETAGRTFEFIEFLTRKLGLTDVGASFPHRVTYHASCHPLRELGLRAEPKALLSNVAGLDLIPLSTEEICCGFGGSFSVIYPEVSKKLMEDKVRSIQESGAEVVVMAETGCLMNIQGGLEKIQSPIRAMHLIQVLAQQETIAAQERSQ